MKYSLALSVLILVSPIVSGAQQTVIPPIPSQTVRNLNDRLAEQAQSQRSVGTERSDYKIGPEDLLDIAVFEVPELSHTVRVSAAGEISLPLLGALKVGNLSPIELERMLTEKLRQSYLKDPQVTVFVKEFHSDPVSVMGAVKAPGLYQIQTRKSLVEVLAMAQGLSEGPMRLPGRDIIITRKVHHDDEPPVAGSNVPAGGSIDSSEMKPNAEIIQVPIKDLTQTGDPKWNVSVYPGDVVTVLTAGTVYVAGDVNHPGGFPLTDFDNISVMQALSMAGGATKTAVRKNAVIVRRDAAGNRLEQKVDLNRIMKGDDKDLILGANDILFVPGSKGRAIALRTLESTIQMATGIAIYSHPF